MMWYLKKKELEEDCVAAVKSMTLLGKCTANMLQFENLENEIYMCATRVRIIYHAIS